MGLTISFGIKLLLRIGYLNVPSKSDGEYKCSYKFQNHFCKEYFNQQIIHASLTTRQQLYTHIINLSTKLNFFAQLSMVCAQVLFRKKTTRSFGYMAQTTEWSFSHF
jgi:hypothetical protein